MSKSNALETDLLNHIFKNTDITMVGDATGLRGSTVAGSLYVSLHTADPAEAGDQSSSETAYTSYARVAVTRGAGWTVSGNTASNAAAITFPAVGVTGATITHFGVGTAASGAGKLLYSGALTGGSQVLVTGNVPEYAIGQLTVTED